MSSKLVISLDFELMWGVRDKRTVANYGDAILGGRAAIPRILDLFEKYGIRATWATVGLLFARNRNEMLEYAPELKPTYGDAGLSPYPSIVESIGANEKEDPWHYGRSLVDRINVTPGQEIATHTYSHYYCLEAGQTLEQFSADIQSAFNIARSANVDVRSIVFPRNQIHPAYLKCAIENGVKVYRDNPGSFLYKSRDNESQTPLVRAGRLIDSILPIDGFHGYQDAVVTNDVVNVPASRIFRTSSPGFQARLFDLQLKRTMAEMKHAAKHQRLYHLWWHPHNFGRHTERNLAGLEQLLQFYRSMQDQYNMTSCSMSDFH